MDNKPKAVFLTDSSSAMYPIFLLCLTTKSKAISLHIKDLPMPLPAVIVTSSPLRNPCVILLSSL